VVRATAAYCSSRVSKHTARNYDIWSTSLVCTRALQPVTTCCQSPYLRPVPSATKPAIIFMTSFFSLWRHLRGSRLRRSQPATKPAILIMTSLATELATPSVTDVRTDTLPRLICKDRLCYARRAVSDSSKAERGDVSRVTVKRTARVSPWNERQLAAVACTAVLSAVGDNGFVWLLAKVSSVAMAAFCRKTLAKMSVKLALLLLISSAAN